MKILVVNGHNREKSFCTSLAAEYKRGAETAGCEVRTVNVRDLNLEKYLEYGHTNRFVPCEEIAEVQNLISWSEKIVFVYPTWWAGPPAHMHLFFEMVFSPGFAFRYGEKDGLMVKWDKLLAGKSARLIVTMDAPPWYYKWIIGDPGGKMVKRGILNFCGISSVQKSYFGSVKLSTEEQRRKWLQSIHSIGQKEKLKR